MDHQFDPLKVALTVVSGRNFQGRKKGEICHASVVFGLGKELYQTEEVESNDPFWNQEAHVNVTGKSHESLVFKIKDQGHTIGIVKIPIKTIPRKKHEEWYTVNPYKKEKDVKGEIRLSCFVSEFRPIPISEMSPSSSYSSSTEELPQGDKKRGLLFHPHRNPSATHLKLSPPPPPDSESKGKYLGDASDVWTTTADSKQQSKAHEEDTGSPSSDNEDRLLPEVTGISPSEGSIEGNERVILRGTNLGTSKEDIVKVTLVNIDCTSTLEYYSSGKLIITTLPRRTPGSGPVIVETISGGVGVSSLYYSFVSRVPTERLRVSENVPSPLQGRKQRLSDNEINEIQADNRAMKQQIKDLKDGNLALHEENMALKEYVERLLSTIMEHKPELLEIAQEKKRNSVDRVIM